MVEPSSTFKDFEIKDSIKIATIGNVDSGKTTLVGVLTKGIADDGRGGARLRVFNYPHEAQNGRTSSIAHEIMGFDAHGKQVLPERYNPNKNKYWAEVVKSSKKVVTLLDLCGHEKYLKTTMFGLVGLVPDYSMIIVGANMGISKMTKEHLGITLALKIPFFIVLTKIDMCPENVYKETMDTLFKILKMSTVNRVPFILKDTADIEKIAQSLASDRICPIFCVSSVSGDGMDILTKFLGLLEMRRKYVPGQDKKEFFEFDINENFMIPGIGIVLSGVMKSGAAKINQVALLGPDKAKGFKSVTLKSIHINRVPAEIAVAGQFACFSIKPTKNTDKLTREEIRRGMVLIDPGLKPEPVWEFEADMVILHHSTTIKEGYQCVMHCGVVRQSIEIKKLNVEVLRTGDKGHALMRFMYTPEFIKKGESVLLREGRTKILGCVTELIHEDENGEKEKILHPHAEKEHKENKDAHKENGPAHEKEKKEIVQGMEVLKEIKERKHGEFEENSKQDNN